MEHVRRGANGAGHGLAKNTVYNVTNSISMEDISKCVFDIILLELFALFV